MKQRLTLSPEDTTSPTVATKFLFLSCLINTVEERSITPCDIMGVYLSTDMTNKLYIVIRQKMVDMLLEVNEKTYQAFVHTPTKGERLLYVLL